MKKTIIVLSILFLFSCERFDKKVKHFKSGISGLDRRITLYTCDGEIIKTWEGNFMIELIGNSASWIDDNNKEVKISGTFIIEEL
tara:strand:+ start:563 stop:817 length:255 start_codon:yes stop_codon:yes gene_type:complete